MQDDQARESQSQQNAKYLSWLRRNIDLINSSQLRKYPYLYRFLIANHDAMRIFLTALLEVLAGEVKNPFVCRLPDKYSCIPVMLTESRLKEKLLYNGMYFSQESLDQTWDVHDKLVLLHSFYLIKRAILPRQEDDEPEPWETPSNDYEKVPKFLYADLYTEKQLALIEDRIRRWSIVTGRRHRLNKDDIIWLYGQREADRIFVPSTRNITGSSIYAKDTFIEAYQRAKDSKHDDKPVTKKDIETQLIAHYLLNDNDIRDLIHRAKIPLFMEYGLQNRQLTAEEKTQYGITDRTYWAIMPVPEEIVEEMKAKRTDWDFEEEPDDLPF